MNLLDTLFRFVYPSKFLVRSFVGRSLQVRKSTANESSYFEGSWWHEVNHCTHELSQTIRSTIIQGSSHGRTVQILLCPCGVAIFLDKASETATSLRQRSTVTSAERAQPLIASRFVAAWKLKVRGNGASRRGFRRRAWQPFLSSLRYERSKEEEANRLGSFLCGQQEV